MVKSVEQDLVILPSEKERKFFTEVETILREGRNKVNVVVNYAMAETYWNIGKRIVEQEQHGNERANYGERLLVNLSRHLSSTFGRGFSVANLWNFRQFYITWPIGEILYTVCRELSWSHIRLIMRLDSEAARNYYIREVQTQGWSVRVLERNIHSRYFERLLSTQALSHPSEGKSPLTMPEDFVKDPYVLEFLGLPENNTEKETKLENAIIGHLQEFLLEMGRGFSFIGRQFRISTETSHFYLDLVFYNYILKCFVVIDLKTQKLTHQDISQIDMYVRMFDDLKRGEGDNPTIGIILCTDKDETIVKYSVLSENRQLFASKYKLVLPTEEELAVELERNVRYLREMQDNEDE